MIDKTIKFFLDNKLATILLLITFIVWGIVSAPFNWQTGFLPTDPVPVDAIPDIGENQQIVYTEWAGRSPQDIDDQISYPLTTALLGIPGIKTIRSNSIFGFSSIYLIFDDDIPFYWSRTRILEKLNSLPEGTLPEGVTPTLGPDATALGQIYWYTLEGRDKDGNPKGGWEPQELRTIQDFYVKYALTSTKGVAEVASIGGFIKEYQIDIDPNLMKTNGITIPQVIAAVKNSNLDIGAKTLEFNRVEYLIRALGYVKSLEDLEKTVIIAKNNVPVRLKDIANIQFGPATRRGGLDKGGAEAVGGVVVARYKANPLEVINALKAKIKTISTGLPTKTLADGSVSKVTIVPFYDRSGLIHETLGTLEEALNLEVLISILVVLILVFNMRASVLISGLLPVGVLMTFIAMRRFGVDANVVALSGIAIAIGVMVDVGIVFTENIIRHIHLPENAGAKGSRLQNIIYRSVVEVAPAVITALTTTIVSFLPVFSMEAAEGKLFRPLAFTKTFAMLAALIIGLIIIPTLANLIFSIQITRKNVHRLLNVLLVFTAVFFLSQGYFFTCITILLIGIVNLLTTWLPEGAQKITGYINIALIALLVVHFLAKSWMPLGAENTALLNFLFVAMVIAAILLFLSGIVYFYPHILRWSLDNKFKFLLLPFIIIVFGITVWQGFSKVFGFLPEKIQTTGFWTSMSASFPGIGKEFMPALDEGSFLLMPTTMPHAGIEENLAVIRLLDKQVGAIPEVESVVGKWGRVSSALDPAPTSMYENLINYKPEYILNEKGQRKRFKVNEDNAFILRDSTLFDPAKEDVATITPDQLIPDPKGKYFRQWRKQIHSPDDIWQEIIKHSKIPGLTSAPKLQPIQTRLVMLQTGMRAPMGIKVFGPDIKSIEATGFQLEKELKSVKGVKPSSVFADRMVGKPYLEIHIDRDAIARYGLSVKAFQANIAGAIGGMKLTSTVEGRERFPIRVRYARELRSNPEDLKKILIATPAGTQVPLGDLASIAYIQGPQSIKSENTFLLGYVIFDKEEEFAEVDVVENAKAHIQNAIDEGRITIPAGVNFQFTGNYENQVRATKRLLLIIPISLMVIFLILYFQFKSVVGAGLIFSGILVAFSGGFIMLWLYGQGWFLDFSVAEMSMRDLFGAGTVNLSVAVWVGFIALFGIATDDGVLISTYLKQIFDKKAPETIHEVRENVLEAGKKRVRPAIMTTATTLIALLPVLTSHGKGSDIMKPMAIPIFGGMVIAILTIFVVPVLFSLWKEWGLRHDKTNEL